MGLKKSELIDAAFQELSLAEGDGFGITPDEKARALRRLDSMLAVWAAKGVRIGYNFGGTLDSDSGIPDSASETVFLKLAERMAPGYGKTLNAATLMNAREGYDTLLWVAARPPEQQLPHTQPRGAGNKPWRLANRNFQPRPDTDPLQFDDDSGNLSILQE